MSDSSPIVMRALLAYNELQAYADSLVCKWLIGGLFGPWCSTTEAVKLSAIVTGEVF